MQLLENHRSTITTVDNEGWKTIYLSQNMIYQIIVNSASIGTVFDVSLENAYGDEVFLAEGNVGCCNETIEIPMATNGTLRIQNTSIDEVFTYCISTKVN